MLQKMEKRLITESVAALNLDSLAHGTAHLQTGNLPQPASALDEYSFQYHLLLILKTGNKTRENINAIEEIITGN